MAEETSSIWLFTMGSHAWQLILPLWYGFLSTNRLHLPAGMPRKMNESPQADNTCTAVLELMAASPALQGL